MSGIVFEFYYDPEEFEPQLSELRIGKRLRNSVHSSPSHDAPLSSEKEAMGVPRGGKTEDNAGSTNSPSMLLETKRKFEKEIGSSTSEKVDKAVVSSKPTPLPETTFRTGSSSSRVRRQISVHALGQYAFCQRAGILAAEENAPADAETLPNLGYLPNYDLAKIEAALQQALRKAGLYLLGVLGAMGLLTWAVMQRDRALLLAAPVVFVVCFYALLMQTIAIVTLVWRRVDARRALQQEPDPEVTTLQPIHWWSLHKAGFESVNYERAFRHAELPMEGCPWRVLERGSERIPVIRSGGRQLGPNAKQLHEKYEVRLAAYAILLEANSHVSVPFGVILAANSTRGLAQPVTPELRAKAKDLLRELAWSLELSVEQQVSPALPERRERCLQCPYGFPERVRASKAHRMKRQNKSLLCLENSAGQQFHCACGDRFGSAPPHRETLNKSLKAVVK